MMRTKPGCVVAARDWASWAEPGRKRAAADTEDRVLANGVVFAVADGASRPGQGDVAATVAITEFARFAVMARPFVGLRDRIVGAVLAANASVRRQANRSPYLGMMTTLCAAVVWDGVVVVVSVGDSRAILLRNGEATPLLRTETYGRPRTFVGASAKLGRVACDVFPGRDGDRLVVLTDGLDCLSAQDVAALAADGTTADAVTRLHIAAFNRGHDDRACVVAALGQVPVPSAEPENTLSWGAEVLARRIRSLIDLFAETRSRGNKA